MPFWARNTGAQAIRFDAKRSRRTHEIDKVAWLQDIEIQTPLRPVRKRVRNSPWTAGRRLVNANQA